MNYMNVQPVNIEKLAARLPHELIGKEVVIENLAIDSRKINANSLFFCLPGEKADGHDFAEQAVAAGATALVVEKPLAIDKPQLKVESTRAALGIMAAEFYGWPCNHIRTVGITGTNGKTTTSFMIDSIARTAGKRSAVIGTLGIRSGSFVRDTSHTTPEALDIQRVFAQLAKENVEVTTMEISSHAIHFNRHYGCLFDALVFTNLSQDHLDFHKTLDDYWAVKRLLFEDRRWQKPGCSAIVNTEEALYSQDIAKVFQGDIFWYGEKSEADIGFQAIGYDTYEFTLSRTGERESVKINLPGKINLLNALAAGTAALSLGFDLKQICHGIEELKKVPGRMEEITPEDFPFKVFVDYAHTPEGLRNVLSACRESLSPGGRLIAVFGCGGDRDQEKRPKMGKIAADLADVAILTSDNPRSEDPLDIIRDVRAGDGGHRLLEYPDRKEAIGESLKSARPGDIVLIAGKGHEQGQIVGSLILPFDDRQVAGDLLGLNND